MMVAFAVSLVLVMTIGLRVSDASRDALQTGVDFLIITGVAMGVTGWTVRIGSILRYERGTATRLVILEGVGRPDSPEFRIVKEPRAS